MKQEVARISTSEVRRALERMKRGKLVLMTCGGIKVPWRGGSRVSG